MAKIGLRQMDVRSLVPPSHYTDSGKLERLIASMESSGWVGRPLLGYGYVMGDDYLLTGRHRFVAAKEADLEEIPCLWISLGNEDNDDDDDDFDKEIANALSDFRDEESLPGILDSFGLAEAVALIEEEIQKNEVA